MPAAVADNPGHLAYYYCFDGGDPDVIFAFQVYRDAASSQAFLATKPYLAYLQEVAPLLVGLAEVTTMIPAWCKAPRGEDALGEDVLAAGTSAVA